jgi:DNA-binding transcriptional MerR regulator
MASGDVFLLSQAARVLEMTESQVKNWTIGRPLQIGPYRSATGTGSRNLYSMHDLYRFTIAQRLSIDGFAAPAIQSVLDALREADLTSTKVAIVVPVLRRYLPRSKGIKLEVQVVPDSQSEQDWLSVVDSRIRTSYGCHVLYIAGITKDVNHQVDKFLQKTFGKRRSHGLAPHQLSRQAEAEVAVTGKEPTRKFRKSEKEETKNASRSED